jgi:uncharacterized protein
VSAVPEPRATEILGTGLAFPLSVDARGRFALVKDEVDIDQAIGLIIDTRPGERPMRPEFGCGVHDNVFENVDAHTTGRIEVAIRQALDRWEPRIEVESIGFDLADLESLGVLRVEIGYRVRATNSLRNLVHPFYVVPAEDAR